jgi:hypothetical protein
MKDRLAALTRGERIVLGGGLLLVVDLVFLPWYSVDLGGLEIAFDPTRTGIQDPYPAYGLVAVILTLVMIAQIVLVRLLSVNVPAPGVSWPQVHLIAGVFVVVVIAVKLARETEFLGYGAYSAILGGVLVAYGGYLIARQEAAPA